MEWKRTNGIMDNTYIEQGTRIHCSVSPLKIIFPSGKRNRTEFRTQCHYMLIILYPIPNKTALAEYGVPYKRNKTNYKEDKRKEKKPIYGTTPLSTKIDSDWCTIQGAIQSRLLRVVDWFATLPGDSAPSSLLLL